MYIKGERHNLMTYAFTILQLLTVEKTFISSVKFQKHNANDLKTASIGYLGIFGPRVDE